jgi:hypothetical protein
MAVRFIFRLRLSISLVSINLQTLIRFHIMLPLRKQCLVEVSPVYTKVLPWELESVQINRTAETCF